MVWGSPLVFSIETYGTYGFSIETYGFSIETYGF